MKYVGYLLLLLLFVYFVFLKPFLLVRNVEFYVKGLRLNPLELRAGFEELYLFVPSKERDLMLRVLNFEIKERMLTAQEVHVLGIGKIVSDKPFDYDFSELTRRSKFLKAYLSRLYVSVNSVPHTKSITVFAGDIHGAEGVFRSGRWARAYVMHGKSVRTLDVFLEKAHAEGDVFHVDRAWVIGEHFSAELRGRWKGKKGDFSSKIRVEEIRTSRVVVAPVSVLAEGELNYTSVRADLKAFTPYVDVVGRRRVEDVSADLVFTYRREEGMRLEGTLQSGAVQAQVKYLISPEERMSLIFKNLELDKKLIGTDKDLRGALSGRLELFLKEKRLILDSFISSLIYPPYSFPQGSLSLDMDYADMPKGELHLSLLGAGSLSLDGFFRGKDLRGTLRLSSFEYRDEKTKLYLDYLGNLDYAEGVLYTVGKGHARDVYYGGSYVGSFVFSFGLSGDDYRVELEGEGLKARGGGSWSEKTFEGMVLFDNFSLEQEELKVAGVRGEGAVKVGRGFASFKGRLGGSMMAEGFSSHFQARIDVQSGEGLMGSFDISLSGIRRGEKELFNRAFIKGRMDGERIEGDYAVDELSEGRFVYNVRRASYRLWGNLSKREKDYSVSAGFELRGKGRDFFAQFNGRVDYGGSSIPLSASLERSQGVWRGSLKGFSLKLLAFDIQVEPFTFEANRGDWKGLHVKLGEDELLRVSSKSISLDLERRVFSFSGRVEGSAVGDVALQYEPSQGLLIRTEGVVDMRALSRMVKSKVLSMVTGLISYSYLYRGGEQSLSVRSQERLSLTSRYLGEELTGWVSLSYDGRIWKGNALFEGNGSKLSASVQGGGKHIKAQMSYKDLLVIYRSGQVRYRGKSNGELTLETDWEEFDIKGSLVVKDGYLDVFSLPEAKEERTDKYKKVKLDIRVATEEPIRVRLPEGQVVASLKGRVFGDLKDTKYRMDVDLLGGKLTYFRKDFFVRQGRLELTEEDKRVNLSISSPTPDHKLSHPRL